MRLATITISFFAFLVGFAGEAVAQDGPRDRVDLRNGGMVRGTIIENIPGEHVTIQLPTGEARTFAAGDVSYAGPDRPAPAAGESLGPADDETDAPVGDAPLDDAPVEPPSQAPEPALRVQVESEHPSLTLHRGVAEVPGATGAPIVAYEPLCSAPCQLELEPGAYRFGIAVGEGQAAQPETNKLITLEEDTVLSLGHHGRGGERALGWTLVSVGAAVLVGSLVTFMVLDDLTASLAVMGGGVAVGLTLALVGALAFAFDQDDFTIEYRPLAVID